MSSMRKRFIKVLGSLMLVGIFLFGGSAVGAPLTKVIQAGFLVGSMNGIFIAKELGYFKEEGLDFEFTEIESGALGAGALVSGNAQFVDLGIDDVANLQSQGKDIVLFYNVENGLSMNLVVRNNILKDRGVTANSPIDQKIKALKGLRIGITRPGAVTQLFPSYMMKKVGLDPERDAQFIQIGRGAALYAAIVADKIDAFMLSAPNPEKVVADGVGTIIIRPAQDVDIFKEFMFTNIGVRRDWAEKNRTLVEGYCKALDRANKFIMENRRKAAEILNKTWYKETPVDILDLTLVGFGSNTDGDMSEKGVKNQLEVYGELKVIEGKFDTSEGVLWTNKYNPRSFPKK